MFLHPSPHPFLPGLQRVEVPRKTVRAPIHRRNTFEIASAVLKASASLQRHPAIWEAAFAEEDEKGKAGVCPPLSFCLCLSLIITTLSFRLSFCLSFPRSGCDFVHQDGGLPGVLITALANLEIRFPALLLSLSVSSTQLLRIRACRFTSRCIPTLPGTVCGWRAG